MLEYVVCVNVISDIMEIGLRKPFKPIFQASRSTAGPLTQWIATSIVLFYLVMTESVSAFSLGTSDTQEKMENSDLLSEDIAYWLEPDDHFIQPGNILLSRARRDASNTTGDLSIWEKIEEFYSDKNNMAMYCVLPILVFIYGGCSAIYCIHKCRLYMRRRKHKRLKEEDCDSLTSDKNDLNDDSKTVGAAERDRPISQISQAWVDMNMDPKGKWSGQAPVQPDSGQSPLPWQIPDKMETSYEQKSSSRGAAAGLDDALKEEDILVESGRRSQTNFSRRGANDALEDKLARRDQSKTMLMTSTINENQKYAEGQEMKQFGAIKEQKTRPPVIRAAEAKSFEDSRVHANLEDYSSNKSTAIKATDFSRFSDSRPIEIVPLSADPHLRGWDPLHNRPYTDQGLKYSPLGAEGGTHETRSASQNIKEEMLARYDALSAFQMAKKAAEILKVNAVEKTPYERKPTKKKHIFIAE
uniref:Uncharacterized protein n=1 Tax=Biomphalaria glabrata TaxID=6526 RepID=A0A2C9KMK3_BIOGL